MPTTYLMKESELILTESKIDGDKPYILKFRDLPQEKRPREQLQKQGPEALTTAELMAIVLGVGTKKEDVLTLAKRILKEYGESAIIGERDPKKLEKALGLPYVKACQLVAVFELGRRFFRVPQGRITVRTPRQVYEYVKDISSLSKEHLRGLYLDARYRILRDETISIGSVSANMIHPREVFRPALEYGASAVILAHNHPSGVTTPSQADLEITKQIIEAGKIMGVHLLDHVIVAGNKFASIPADYDV